MKKVAVTGPESTGKSALCKELAEHLNTIFVEEFARAYLENLGRPYEEKDLLRIAISQCAAEDEAALTSPPLLICDTDMLVMKIWSEVKYNRVHPFIMNQYRRRKYDLVLLMDIDLPWEEDPLREHPFERQELYTRYETSLKEMQCAYEVIRGTGPERLKSALAALRKHRLIDRE